MKLQKKVHTQLDFNFDYQEFKLYENPQNENEIFFNLQAEWLKNRNPKAWSKMWEIVDLLARKALTKELHRRHVTIDSDRFEEIVNNVTDVLLSRYQKYCGYYFKFIVTAVYYETNKQLSNRNDEYYRKLVDLLNSKEITLDDIGVYSLDEISEDLE